MVSDSSRPPWRAGGLALDAVVTDPPYGIREPTTRVGAKKEDAAAIPEELAAWHIPQKVMTDWRLVSWVILMSDAQKVEYGVRELYVDLLNFSARHLVPGGRLAFWMPVNR